MPNLVITNACNLGCPFCFATEYRVEPTANAVAAMSLDEFRDLISFAGTDTVRFCGGEPTLHPEFLRMLKIALEPAERQVFIMTNGLWPGHVLNHVTALDAAHRERITYLINVLPPELYSDAQQEALLSILEALPANRVTLGLTIGRTPFDYRHLLELAGQAGVEQIRFSVAAPNLTDPDSWRLQPERHFAPLAQIVYKLIRDARARGLRVQSDCGYIPPCMFSDAQLAWLRDQQHGVLDLAFHCSGPVDIGPGGEAWRCYGLYSRVRARTDGFDNCGELAAHFERRTAELGEQLLLDACADCQLRANGECGGGCHAFRALREMRSRSESNQISIDADEDLLRAIPRIDPHQLRRHGTINLPRFMLLDHGEWTELETTPLERTFLEACDGHNSVAEIMALLQGGAGQNVTPSAVARIARKLFELRAISLSPGET